MALTRDINKPMLVQSLGQFQEDQLDVERTSQGGVSYLILARRAKPWKDAVVLGIVCWGVPGHCAE